MGSMSARCSDRSRTPRLDAYLSRAGLASRSLARGLIRTGQVHVDGEVCRDPARRISDETVTLREERVTAPGESGDYLIHKPVGVACSHDSREAPRVFDLLNPVLQCQRLRIAGRLDRATSGLLVLTTDGGFVHRLTHPTRHVSKRYRVSYSGTLSSDAIERCRNGFVLAGEEKPTRPAELALEQGGRATLVLREGRTHQVRRMMRALGGEVQALHRDRVGLLDLPADLAPGEWRPLALEERALLLSERTL